MKEFNLLDYMNIGIERVVKNILKASLINPKESIFMIKFAENCKKAYGIRKKYKEEGKHIPPILIASITSKCNLHCAGCYARAVDTCNDDIPIEQLTDEDWYKIFEDAKKIGISFIILIGGEPMIRKDVIKKAGQIPEILFPIFTNGTLLDDEYIELFEKHRNLVPIFSIEGNLKNTDLRRGDGIYKKILLLMDELDKKKILYGTSITVTANNLDEVTSNEFVQNIYNKGGRAIFFIEYVPTSEETKKFVLTDEMRDRLIERVNYFREEMEDMIVVSFPGDEKSSGGCLAAGRGFFHINSHGGAEPCPFSPYSDINIKNTSLLHALDSKLFSKLQMQDVLNESHMGGCVLYEKREQVENLLYNK